MVFFARTRARTRIWKHPCIHTYASARLTSHSHYIYAPLSQTQRHGSYKRAHDTAMNMRVRVRVLVRVRVGMCVLECDVRDGYK